MPKSVLALILAAAGCSTSSSSAGPSEPAAVVAEAAEPEPEPAAEPSTTDFELERHLLAAASGYQHWAGSTSVPTSPRACAGRRFRATTASRPMRA